MIKYLKNLKSKYGLWGIIWRSILGLFCLFVVFLCYVYFFSSPDVRFATYPANSMGDLIKQKTKDTPNYFLGFVPLAYTNLHITYSGGNNPPFRMTIDNAITIEVTKTQTLNFAEDSTRLRDKFGFVQLDGREPSLRSTYLTGVFRNFWNVETARRVIKEIQPYVDAELPVPTQQTLWGGYLQKGNVIYVLHKEDSPNIFLIHVRQPTYGE
jgi:hypothetical protein